jgi:phosphatidylglycerophosphate synthase
MVVPSDTNTDDLTHLALNAALSFGIGLFLVLVLALIGKVVLGLQAEFVAWSTFSFAGIAIGLSFLLRYHLPWRRFGPGNHVTLSRAVLVALLAGMIAGTEDPSAHGWLIAVVVTLDLVLDGIDGWIARRSGMDSPFGARFDMEVDALLTLVLAILIFQAERAGAWVLLAGGLRYVFVASGWVLPLLRAPLPSSRRRQTICVIQTAALALCLIPAVAVEHARVLAAGALGLVALSFGRDILWLIRHARETGKGT